MASSFIHSFAAACFILLVQLPSGDWYCSHECEKLKEQINVLVAAGDISCSPYHTWQLLRGKDGNEATKKALQAAGDILQSSFDPIMDAASNMDLLPLIIKAKVGRGLCSLGLGFIVFVGSKYDKLGESVESMD
jgi:hypothetical protein